MISNQRCSEPRTVLMPGFERLSFRSLSNGRIDIGSLRCNRHTARADATAAYNSKTATNSASIAGIVIRGTRAEPPPALADCLFNATDPKPNADFISVRLFRVDRADQT